MHDILTITKDAHICVVGLGYVGLPLARLLVESGYQVTGIDVDETKIRQLLSGGSYLSDLSNDDIHALFQSGRFSCDTSFKPVAQSSATIICVPTPLTEEGQPDLSYVTAAAASISLFLQKSQLVVLESSTFPGTTEDYVIPILEGRGLTAGRDFFVAYSPERINPGDSFDIRKIPKVVGGIDPESTRLAVELYEKVFERVVVVSSIRVAELTKLLENTQRFINISLMNELAMICDKWKINLWEAIDAASTKPYGFTPYFPGPGVGGHCIPVDPLYLQWIAEKYGYSLEFIKLARQINEAMPEYVMDRIMRLCSSNHPQLLLVGLTYKPDVNDLRESPAVDILKQLQADGHDVMYHDPFIKEIDIGGRILKSVDLTPEVLQQVDVVAILTNHSNVDYEMIMQHARAVLDTRNAFGMAHNRPNIESL
ncbi:nucleotide sugar dehydrogenase [Alicyclobacillus kakegawensis]|uniref:nucleotide sugar dehydrogenase n=1 Tax=Alicyclobacillus kakegawensis TaxID=392012 RepID=UPI00082F71E6|nr:nucleotide sugar dehydrogenase [Alicyclobacillus kakegawensis]